MVKLRLKTGVAEIACPDKVSATALSRGEKRGRSLAFFAP